MGDGGDYGVVGEVFEEGLGEMGKVIVLGGVWGGGWVIEMEWMGRKMMKDREYGDF